MVQWAAMPGETRKKPPAASRYHSPLRARQAAETRQAIIAAAINLFRDKGWAATTLPMIAGEAGTAVDTIYSTFGSKSNLLMAAVDVAIVGDDEEAAMIDRPGFAQLGTGRKIERLRAGVHFTVGVYQRSVPLLMALKEAAARDEAARARLTRYDDDRREVTAAGLALILRTEVADKLVDALSALVSPEVFTYLTEGRGWSIASTEAWLVEMSTAALGMAAH